MTGASKHRGCYVILVTHWPLLFAYCYASGEQLFVPAEDCSTLRSPLNEGCRTIVLHAIAAMHGMNSMWIFGEDVFNSYVVDACGR